MIMGMSLHFGGYLLPASTTVSAVRGVYVFPGVDQLNQDGVGNVFAYFISYPTGPCSCTRPDSFFILYDQYILSHRCKRITEYT